MQSIRSGQDYIAEEAAGKDFERRIHLKFSLMTIQGWRFRNSPQKINLFLELQASSEIIVLDRMLHRREYSNYVG